MQKLDPASSDNEDGSTASNGDGNDNDGFARWYGLAYPKLLATMVLVVGDLEEAKEAVDEACVRTLVHWSKISKIERPEGWTYRVAYNVFRRRARRRSFESRFLNRQTKTPDLPAPAGEIWLLVNELPSRQREVVMLRYVADLTEREIATTLGITRGSVSRSLGTARQRLAADLAEPPNRSGDISASKHDGGNQRDFITENKQKNASTPSPDALGHVNKAQINRGAQCHD